MATATLAFVHSNLSAQDGFQVLLDTLSDVDRAAVLSDGSIAIAMFGDDKNVIWIADSDGFPQSSFSVPSPVVTQAFEIIANPSGGMYLASVTDVNAWSINEFDVDTFTTTLHVMAVSTDGTVGFSRDISLTTYSSSDVWWGGERINLAADDLGLYISMSDGLSFAQENWYIKMSPAGELLWCTAQTGGSFVPGENEFAISPSGNGGLYFSLTNISGATDNTAMGKLDAQGGLDWVARFAYLNNVITLEMNDVITTSTGRPMAAGSLIGPGFGYGYLLSPTADGTGVSGHLYDLPAGTDRAFRSIHELPNGDLFATTWGVWDTEENLGILHLGTDMEVVNARRTEVVPSGQNDNWHLPEIIGAIGDRAVLPGSLRSVDQIFGYIQHHPSIWKLDLDAMNACMVSETTIPHYAIPDSLLSVQQLTNITFTPYAAEVEDGPLSITPESPVPISDLCAALVSVPESAINDPFLSTYPSPATMDGTLTVQCDGAIRLSLISAAGSLVRSIPMSFGTGTVTFACSDLLPGLYGLVAFGKDGERLATSKVEVR